MKKRTWLWCLLCGALLLAGTLWGFSGGRQLYRYWKAAGSSGTSAEKRVIAYAEANGIPFSAYPEALIDLLERNPETEQFVLEYPTKKGSGQEVDLSEYADTETVPLFLQWDPRWGYIQYGSDVAGLTGCGPVCLSMAAYYVTRDPDMSPDRIIRFALEEGYCVPGNGTAWTLMSQGGPALGLEVEELPLDEGCIKRALAQDKPVICIMGPGDFTASGHYIVVTGVENGLLRVNDPNSWQNSQRLWDYEDICDQIRNLWSVGPGTLPETNA